MRYHIRLSRLTLAILIVVTAVGLHPTTALAGKFTTSMAGRGPAVAPRLQEQGPDAVTEEDLTDLEAGLVAIFQVQVDALFSDGLDDAQDEESQAEFDWLVGELGRALHRYYVEQGHGTVEDARQRMRYRLDNISDSGIGLAESYVDWAVAQVVATENPVDVPAVTDYPQGEGQGLQTSGRDVNGTVSGVYDDPAQAGPRVGFSVTADGTATFQAEGARGLETVVARYVDEAQATVEWNGVEIDGYGPLTSEQRVMLSDVSSSALNEAIALIPLDLGCRDDAEMEPLQLAALLLPWQMRLKYLSVDRVEEVGEMAVRSACSYFTGGDSLEIGSVSGFGGEQGLSSQVLLSRAAPVPVVMGYFPFDADGALEPISSLGGNTSCRMPTAFAGSIAPQPLFTMNLDTSSRRSPGHLSLVRTAGRVTGVLDDLPQAKTVKVDEFGPCVAMCRGACGMDCTLTNCEQAEEWRCVQAEEGINIGNGDMLRTVVYDCGVHAGCITHDSCYDACNSRWGCGTFVAAHCRHITPAGLIWGGDIVGKSCDGDAISAHGRATALTWARGGGPYQERWQFEYNDPFPTARDLIACPPAVSIEWKETGNQPGEVQFTASTIQPVGLPTSFEFKWTLPDPVGVVNGGIGFESVAVKHVFPGPGTYHVLLTLMTLDGQWVRDEGVAVTVTGTQDPAPSGGCASERFHVAYYRGDGTMSSEYDFVLLPPSAWYSLIEEIKGEPLGTDEIAEMEEYYAADTLEYSNMEALARVLPEDCFDAIMQGSLWVLRDGSYVEYSSDGTASYQAQFNRGLKVSDEQKSGGPVEGAGQPVGGNPFGGAQ